MGYVPTTGRWLSIDPVNAIGDGVELIDGPAQLAPYMYAFNNSVNYSDPSGLQAKKNVCCDCEDAVQRLLGESDYQYPYLLIPGYHPEPLHSKRPPELLYRCRVNIACESVNDCGPKGMAGTLPGFTNPPVEVLGNPLYRYEIDICVSCRYSPIDYLIQHELVHAKQYCTDPTLDLTDCNRCRKAETQAHTVNCWLAFGDNKLKRNRCIACGVAISCAGPCPPKKVDPKTGLPIVNGKACDLSKDFGGTWEPATAE